MKNFIPFLVTTVCACILSACTAPGTGEQWVETNEPTELEITCPFALNPTEGEALPNPPMLIVDPSMEFDGAWHIASFIFELDRETNIDLKTKVKPCDGTDCIKSISQELVTALTEEYYGELGPNDYIVGVVSPDNGVYIANDSNHPEFYKLTIWHELGHWLGLKHSPDNGTIMTKNGWRAKLVLGDFEVNGLCALWDCSGHNEDEH